jgi:hypothetical protein
MSNLRGPRSLEERSRHEAGDHTLCSPDRPGHGVCSECGKTVQVNRTSASPERRRCRDCQRARPRGAVPQVCKLCQEPYVPRHGARADQSLCSKSCAQAWRNGARPPYSKQVVTGMARKTELRRIRSQRHQETWDGVTDEQIFKRDRWQCGICGQRIGKSFSYPHPRSKSIDHVVPLIEGGDDTAANKRAAHLLCNTMRRDRGGNEQLAMIG